MFLQFTRIANIFYVAVAVLQFFPAIRSNTPLGSILPVTFVVLLGMLRELLTDIKRWREDKLNNSRTYTIHTEMGDIVKRSD